MPQHKVLHIFSSIYFTALYFYTKLLICLEFILAYGGEVKSNLFSPVLTYCLTLFPHCLMMPRYLMPTS